MLDFNYEEVVDVDNFLDARGVRHHVEFYPGPHAWPPAPVMEDAITWLELQAMRRRLEPKNDPWIDSLFAARAGAADAADASHQEVSAYQLYRAVASDFRGLRDVGDAEHRVVRLEENKEVRRVLERQREMQVRYQEYFASLRRVVVDLRRPGARLELSHLLKQLSIGRLQREAANQGDSALALSAQRLLEQVFSFASFYWPRIAFDDGNPAKALAVLELAEVIHPGREGVCENRKEALRQLGRADSAAATSCVPPASP
jgi:hypothetical protein